MFNIYDERDINKEEIDLNKFRIGDCYKYMGTYNGKWGSRNCYIRGWCKKCSSPVEKDEEIKLCYESLCRICINGKTKIKKIKENKYKNCINCCERFKPNNKEEIYCKWCLNLNIFYYRYIDINKDIDIKNKFKIIVNKLILNIKIKKYLLYNKVYNNVNCCKHINILGKRNCTDNVLTGKNKCKYHYQFCDKCGRNKSICNNCIPKNKKRNKKNKFKNKNIEN